MSRQTSLFNFHPYSTTCVLKFKLLNIDNGKRFCTYVALSGKRKGSYCGNLALYSFRGKGKLHFRCEGCKYKYIPIPLK
jgi:hypothetical protein